MCFRVSHIKKQENLSGLLTPLQLLFHYSDSLYSQIPRNTFCKHCPRSFPPRALLHSDTSRGSCQGSTDVLRPNLKKNSLAWTPFCLSRLCDAALSGAFSCFISCSSDFCMLSPSSSKFWSWVFLRALEATLEETWIRLAFVS